MVIQRDASRGAKAGHQPSVDAGVVGGCGAVVMADLLLAGSQESGASVGRPMLQESWDDAGGGGCVLRYKASYRMCKLQIPECLWRLLLVNSDGTSAL
jgi:hypothetical protein